MNRDDDEFNREEHVREEWHAAITLDLTRPCSNPACLWCQAEAKRNEVK